MTNERAQLGDLPEELQAYVQHARAYFALEFSHPKREIEDVWFISTDTFFSLMLELSQTCIRLKNRGHKDTALYDSYKQSEEKVERIFNWLRDNDYTGLIIDPTHE